MPRKKPEEWIEVREAAVIMSANNGRPISPDYVRLLGHKGHISMKPKDGRTNLYLKSDVEAYKVRQKGKKENAFEGKEPFLSKSS
jgi:hypothetical protein